MLVSTFAWSLGPMVWARVSRLPLPTISFRPEGVHLPREEASGLGSPPELAGPRLTLDACRQSARLAEAACSTCRLCAHVGLQVCYDARAPTCLQTSITSHFQLHDGA